jgi:hypothetical protein
MGSRFNLNQTRQSRVAGVRCTKRGLELTDAPSPPNRVFCRQKTFLMGIAIGALVHIAEWISSR